MAWIVVVLGALLVIGPIFWIMPSPRDRRLAQLRSQARTHGFELVDVELPQTRRERVRQEESQRGMLYRMPVARDRNGPTPTWRWVRERPQAEWVHEGGEPPAVLAAEVAQLLAALPTTVRAFEVGTQGPGIYWREQGNEQTLVALAALLKPLAEQVGTTRKRDRVTGDGSRTTSDEQ